MCAADWLVFHHPLLAQAEGMVKNPLNEQLMLSFFQKLKTKDVK